MVRLHLHPGRTREIVSGVLILVASCDNELLRTSSNPPGSVIEHPAAESGGSKRFVVDPNSGGAASELRVSGLFWGRLVDVLDQDASGRRRLQHKDMVIGDDIRSDAHDYLLGVDPITGVQTLVILHEQGASEGRYEAAFARLDHDLIPIHDAPLGGSSVFQMVPRNAVIVVRFDDLLDEETADSSTVAIHEGYPPLVLFEGRVLPDQNHGDLVIEHGAAVFHSTRLILDPTVSEIEALETDPPREVNPMGLPASADAVGANVLLRIPTHAKPSIGQGRILLNLSGHSLATSANGTIDFASPTVDLVRAMRSGGESEDTGDPHDGFLFDEESPRLIGRLLVTLLREPYPDPTGADERDFLIGEIAFLSEACRRQLRAGDVLQQDERFVQILGPGYFNEEGTYEDVPARLLVGDPATWPHTSLGPAELFGIYEPELDAQSIGCFAHVTPAPSGYANDPGLGLTVDAEIGLRFSKPMAPTSMSAFDTLTLTRSGTEITSSDYVVGVIRPSADLRRFAFVPSLPLAHESGATEHYWLTLVSGERGPTDLVGHPLPHDVPQIVLELDPLEREVRNGSRVSRFTSLDEEDPIGTEEAPLPEWTGQHMLLPSQELLRPRPVTRFLAIADRTQPILNLFLIFAPGVQTPLSNLGSRMQTVWRYADVGFALTDLAHVNLDVEGISWSPTLGQVIADRFTRYEIVLSHSKQQPEERLAGAIPAHPISGLKLLFVQNHLDTELDPPAVVHPRHLGYTILPSDVYSGSTGTALFPYPMNRSLPASEWRRYTWRDTSILERAAPDSDGVDLGQLWAVLGTGVRNLMRTGKVSTIGLPLLMDFRCFPDDAALGQNPINIHYANNISPQPHFRAFSTGGVNQAGQVIRIDPDLEEEANGGFDPTSNPPGAQTPPRDNSSYWGALDLVTRVSRTYSVWFEALGTTSPRYFPPVVEPRPDELPEGTAVEVAFRGANVVEPLAARTDAESLDGYGDHYVDPANDRNDPNVSMSLLGDGKWEEDVTQIDGARYYQVRITYLANPETTRIPEISSLALAWSD